MRRRWLGRSRREPLTPELEHYLTLGCYQQGTGSETHLDVFLLAGRVMRGNVAVLRRLWRDYREDVKAAHRETFAEAVLAGVEHSRARRQCTAHAVHPTT